MKAVNGCYVEAVHALVTLALALQPCVHYIYLSSILYYIIYNEFLPNMCISVAKYVHPRP